MPSVPSRLISKPGPTLPFSVVPPPPLPPDVVSSCVVVGDVASSSSPPQADATSRIARRSRAARAKRTSSIDLLSRPVRETLRAARAVGSALPAAPEHGRGGARLGDDAQERDQLQPARNV